jgi:hypothetical protein
MHREHAKVAVVAYHTNRVHIVTTPAWDMISANQPCKAEITVLPKPFL